MCIRDSVMVEHRIAAGEEPADADRDHGRNIADAFWRKAPAQSQERAEKRDDGSGEGAHDLDEQSGAERASPQRQLQGGSPDPVAARRPRFSGRAGETAASATFIRQGRRPVEMDWWAGGPASGACGLARPRRRLQPGLAIMRLLRRRTISDVATGYPINCGRRRLRAGRCRPLQYLSLIHI